MATALALPVPAGPALASVSAPVHRRAILVIVLVGYFMVILDNSVVFTGIPAIRRDLHLTVTGLSWVQDAYTLTFGGLLLLASRMGDLIGRRRLFIIGLVLFTVASALVGAAPTAWWLVAARAVQGVGAAIVAPTSLALLTATFAEGAARARAVSLYAAVAGIGASVGLVVGGALTELISWRAGFLVNLPIGAAMVVLAARAIPVQPARRGRFDVAGAVLATVGVGAITFGVVQAADGGWTTPRTFVPVAVGALLLVLLVRHEARTAQPIMPLHLFADRARAGSYGVRFLYLGAMIGFFFYTTQLMQNVLGFSPLLAGLGFLPMTAVNFVVAMRVQRILARLRTGPVLVTGVALTLAGMLCLSRADAGSSYLMAIAPPMLLIGAGQGLAFAPLTSLGLRDVTVGEAGAASGVLNTVHQLGSCLGLAALTTAAAEATSTAAEVRIALTGSSVILAAALAIAVFVIAPATRPVREGAPR